MGTAEMAKIATKQWDPAEHIRDDTDVAAYVEAALEDGDHRVLAAVLGDIARAKGMTWVARETGMGRESLYKSLSSEGNPELATVLKVIRALGIRLRATVAGDNDLMVGNPMSASVLADEGEEFEG